MSLPLVNTDVSLGIMRDMDDDNWLEDCCGKIDKNNPMISHFLADLIQPFEEATQHAIMYAAVSVYRMLEVQAESDELERIYG